MKTRPTILLSTIAAVMAMAMTMTGVAARAADDFSTARDLYASAAYEEALAALNRVRAAGTPPADAFAVEQYRAFCLLALGRGPEAQTSIEALVMADPLYQPSSEMSPRVRNAFSEVRRRLLPSIIPQHYAKAKAAFDRKDYKLAASSFSQVLAVMADPEVAQLAGQPPLSDLRTLATGFQELSAKAIVPPPPPPLVVAPPVAVAAPKPVPAVVPAAPPPPPRVFTSADTKVMTPVATRQDLPAFTGRVFELTVGALEIIIDERGLVETATIRESLNPAYDRVVVDATRNWRYRPATLDGVPVKFRKLISISLKPTS